MEKNSQNMAIALEALLFALGKPLSRADLVRMLELTQEEIEVAIAYLIAQTQSDSRGIVLVDDGRVVELRTAPAVSQLIDRVRRDDMNRDLGRAGAEVIAILLYKGSSTRSQIDFIRGVNSGAALRTLSMRGLVRKSPSQYDRSVTYELTPDLIASLGVSQPQDAPAYAAIKAQLEALKPREENN